MSERVDLYREIHKGLRAALSQLLNDAGRVDPSNDDAVAAIFGRCTEMAGTLEEHAGHEDRWVLPLLKAADPELAEQLEEEHAEINGKLATACGLFEQAAACPTGKRGPALTAAYANFAVFVGRYLTHTGREEFEVMPLLQGAHTDAELLEVQGALRASVPPPRMAMYLGMMLPAINVDERTTMLGGMKMFAPPEAFAGACAVASDVLTADEWGVVRRRLEI